MSTERLAGIDALLAWGFFKEHPDPDPQGRRRTGLTPLGYQLGRFMEAPHEEPGFLAAWIAAFERRYGAVQFPLDDDTDLMLQGREAQMAREGWYPEASRIRAFLEARTLYRLAKAGDVRAFHRALMMTALA
jgi:hypothetical protein